ncbi:MAG TPA: flagellar motor protein MotB, partial [Nitrospiria bacterium]|nr:flagellar motor protein MotB [Nitrospiria bacterium]
VSVWGCGGMRELREENALLQSEVARLQQVQDDYTQEMDEIRRLSDSEKEKMRSDMDEMQRRMTENLNDQINRNEALVQQLQGLTVIEIGEAALFPSGSADLSRKGTKIIQEMSDVLSQYGGFHVRVEGHTDSRPIGESLKKTFPSNWELSTARATNVIKYMVYAMKLDPARLQAVGYAQFRPIASNDTAAGRAKNRRIRMVVFKAAEGR